MKKIIALVIALALTLSLAACGSSVDENSSDISLPSDSQVGSNIESAQNTTDDDNSEKVVSSNGNDIISNSNNSSTNNSNLSNSKPTSQNNSSSYKPSNNNTENKTPTTSHKHNYTKKIAKPTCTEKGYTTYICSCGDNYKSDYVNAKGHTEVIDPAIEATTTSTGLTEGKHCSVCNIVIVKQTVVPKKVSPSESSTFQIKKNDILKTYSSLYDYNEYSIDYVDIEKKDTSDSKFQITVTIGAVMLLIPEDMDDVPDYIKGYWELKKDGKTVSWNIFTISSVEELEYRETSFTCKNLEAGTYTLHFTSYI